MLKDLYGNALTTGSGEAMAHYNEALTLIRLYRGDPMAAIDAALTADPDFTMAWAVRAGLLAQQMDKLYAEETERSLRAGAASADRASDAERAHLAAARDWAEGRFERGVTGYARIARENPRDLFAVQTAHVGCFYLGRQSELRDWALQAKRGWSRDDVGYHAVLGMAAFGLEECGDYGRADAFGREAVEIEPRDGWAVHAVAHVNEMRGDLDAGIPWLADNAQYWAPESGFAFHNWWHLALLHLDKGDAPAVLRLYDEKVRPAQSDILLEWIDAAALLWRLRLEGVDVNSRFAALADCVARASEDGIYAFNDLHVIMAMLGAGRVADAERVVAAMRRALVAPGDNALMTKAVGLPLAEAFIAFEAGRYGETVDTIAAVRGIAQRFGGSHAQRDILNLTALHAAIRGGMAQAAAAFAAERIAHKPHSPWAQRLAVQARAVRSERIAA